MNACFTCLANLLQVCRAPELIRDGNKAPDVRQQRLSEPSGRIALRAKEMKGTIGFLCRGWAARASQVANRQQILSVLLPGELISPALVVGDADGWFVKSITDIEYRLFDLGDILKVARKKSKAQELILRAVAQGIRQSEKLAMRLSQFSAEEKIASLLTDLVMRLDLRGVTEAISAERTTIPFPLRQRHIAEATGMTPVHVSNILGDMERRRIVELAHRMLSILDWSALRRLATIQPDPVRGSKSSGPFDH